MVGGRDLMAMQSLGEQVSFESLLIINHKVNHKLTKLGRIQSHLNLKQLWSYIWVIMLQ